MMKKKLYFCLFQTIRLKTKFVVSVSGPKISLRAQSTNSDMEIWGFKNKSTKQLVKTVSILKFCSYRPFVEHGEMILRYFHKAFGKTFTTKLLQTTFYDQFCIGDSAEEILKKCNTIKKENMFPLLCITAEEKTNPSSYKFGEIWFDTNKENMLKCIDLICMTIQLPTVKPVQMKLTAILDAKICKKLSDVILAGQTEELVGWLQTIAKNRLNVLNQVSFLSADEQRHTMCGVRRLIDVLSFALKKQVNVLVDAEYGDINPAITFISTHMMLFFNKNAPVVQCTYQCYLKNSYKSIAQDMEFCQRANIHFGAKVVRGAYLESERRKAKQSNLEAPVFDTWQQTNENYDKVVAKLIGEIAANNKKCHLMVASHNKESVELAVNSINELGIEKSSTQIMFAQLYGLSDHLSFWLANNGFQVYKSSPIGSVDETIPYMIRRANENNSVIQNSRGDQKLMMQEILFRLLRIVYPM